ncbi:hypothetical protein CXB51_021277 [Gossypium anomalum]|uniref:Polygalacturonase n=1 Tax=Gossypium anomalum TaxID=47600 RepID=A0A8J6CZ79_9ROSI|nr:hypothetical protein CXB51_021277 [Gossypium anomalum]
MFLKALCLPLVITFLSLSSYCFGLGRYREEDPFHVDFRRGRAYHHPTSYRHPYFRTFGVRATPKVVNVNDFGAKANGRDDSQAFKIAWNYACSSSQGAIMVVPKKKIYRLKPINFSGPCKSPLLLKIYGTFEATKDHSDYQDNGRRWLYFDNVENLRVEGGGIIDAFNLLVTAPGNSPNTDGIHVTGTQNIYINNCVIGTGDDCISIVSSSKNVRATGITCGPGHGISIGSLGAGNTAAYVSNVIVNKATLSGTEHANDFKQTTSNNFHLLLDFSIQFVDLNFQLSTEKFFHSLPNPNEILKVFQTQNISGTSEQCTLPKHQRNKCLERGHEIRLQPECSLPADLFAKCSFKG